MAGSRRSPAQVLYITPQESATSLALAEAARRRNIAVVAFRSAADVVDGDPYLYGGPRFALTVSSTVPVALLEPVDDWLVRLPVEFRRREISLAAVSDARQRPGRWFIKTPREKTFEPGIRTADDLDPADGEVSVLISDIVTFTREYRLLVLDGQVHTASRYLSGGHLDTGNLENDRERDSVLAFAGEVLADQVGELPSAVVVDVGWAVNADTGDEGWAVVEANMAWFSTIYGCDPDRALDVVMRSAGPQEHVSGSDTRFIRSEP